MNIPGVLRRNDLEPEELAAIAIYIHTENQVFSWENTIGKTKKSKNPTVPASRFFNRSEVIRYLDNWKYNNEQQDGKKFNVQSSTNKDLSFIAPDQDIEITSENIKQILQSEFQSIKDPDKRAVILMKIADFVGLKNSDQDDPLTPTIYLPARCSQCKQLKVNA